MTPTSSRCSPQVLRKYSVKRVRVKEDDRLGMTRWMSVGSTPRPASSPELRPACSCWAGPRGRHRRRDRQKSRGITAAQWHEQYRLTTSTGWPTRWSTSSTTSRRCRLAARFPGTCSTTRRPACRRCRGANKWCPRCRRWDRRPMRPRCCWSMPAPPRACACARRGNTAHHPGRHAHAAARLRAAARRRQAHQHRSRAASLFIEEAREEVGRALQERKLYPHEQTRWKPMRSPAYAARSARSKVSGRMVGATDVAEFAWSVEDLLNKIIENTLQRSPSILATIRDASAVAGELVDALEAGQGARPRKCRTSSIAHMR